jgi:type I restriction enzyme, S subunit
LLRFVRRPHDGQEFPEWEEKTLGELCDVKGGKRIPKGYSLQNESNGLPYITVTDMYKGGVDSKDIRYVPSEVAELIKNYKITTNDLCT